MYGNERRICILILVVEKCMGTRKENLYFDIGDLNFTLFCKQGHIAQCKKTTAC